MDDDNSTGSDGGIPSNYLEIAKEKVKDDLDDSGFTIRTSEIDDDDNNNNNYDDVYLDEMDDLDEECRGSRKRHTLSSMIESELEAEIARARRRHRINTCYRWMTTVLLIVAVTVGIVILIKLSSNSVPSALDDFEEVGDYNDLDSPDDSITPTSTTTTSTCPDHLIDASSWYETTIKSSLRSITFNMTLQNNVDDQTLTDVGLNVWTHPAIELENALPITIHTPLPPIIQPQQSFVLHFSVDLSFAPKPIYDLAFMPIQKGSSSVLYETKSDIPIIGKVQIQCQQ